MYMHSALKRRVHLCIHFHICGPPAFMHDLTLGLAGRRILVGRRPMSRVARAVEKGETQGFIKIVVDADTHQILGLQFLASAAMRSSTVFSISSPLRGTPSSWSPRMFQRPRV